MVMCRRAWRTGCLLPNGGEKGELLDWALGMLSGVAKTLQAELPESTNVQVAIQALQDAALWLRRAHDTDK